MNGDAVGPNESRVARRIRVRVVTPRRDTGRATRARANTRPRARVDGDPMSRPRARATATLAQRLKRYLERDARDIVWPRAMDDPPWYKAQRARKLTLDEHKEVWTKAWEMYKQSWVNAFRRDEGEEEEATSTRDESEEDARRSAVRETSTTIKSDDKDSNEGRLLADEAKQTLRAGKAGFKPFVTYLYETRGRAYRDGVREFIKAYREGFREASEELETGESFSSKAASLISKAEDVLEKAEKTETDKIDDDGADEKSSSAVK